MEDFQEKGLIRIEKYLSEKKILSRRESKDFLEKGFILVNQKKALPGDKINPTNDKIILSKKAQEYKRKKMTVLVYKPRGVICSKDEGARKNIFDIFPDFKHLHTVGRLDKESEGLILLSNDGIITKIITGKDHRIEKEYIVSVREKVSQGAMKKMSQGMKLEDGWTLPTRAEKIDTHRFRIILKEGKKHQIRRMANKTKMTVESLRRIRIHTIRAQKMISGNFRILSEKEINHLKTF